MDIPGPSCLQLAVRCKTERRAHSRDLQWLQIPTPRGSRPDRLSMRVTLAVAAWMASLVSSYSYPANTLPDIENEDFIKDCVRVHNKFRSEVNPAASDMLYMTWDPVLAQIAKAWARHCQFAHNSQLKPPYKLHPNFTSLGENIWTGSRSLFSVSSAITAWYNEMEYYDFKTRKCSKVCGHYTQVVWADSYKVGCAVQSCPKVSGFETLSNGAHFICNYGPAGNYPTWPYKKGSTCTACPRNDICLDNLCANPQRDNVTRYYSTVYPDWPISSRNRYISLFLIVSPPILLLGVIITIWVKHKYPHI
ncbi:glioma pathogenesis-related protein 1 isoform X1 [Diceros bicornis minor]|uniref:glioma pathogenesis-related protein 1 isoform X1 n=1 Tax=Diceros bicornis minor TaxID=77932 RepID=UPI0026EBA1E0|nr:glioma pathogenesis-related protein 1 isoform X1 [Diceros bicornis minor]